MKKLILTLVVLASSSAFAGGGSEYNILIGQIYRDQCMKSGNPEDFACKKVGMTGADIARGKQVAYQIELQAYNSKVAFYNESIAALQTERASWVNKHQTCHFVAERQPYRCDDSEIKSNVQLIDQQIKRLSFERDNTPKPVEI